MNVKNQIKQKTTKVLEQKYGIQPEEIPDLLLKSWSWNLCIVANPRFTIEKLVVLDCSDSVGRGLENQRDASKLKTGPRHCIVLLSKTLYVLLSTGSTK